jgi:archaellum component FlaG (FlaF/FlaG flagellin family)
MESKNIGLMLAAFVMIIVGAALIGVIADTTQDVTKTTPIASESVTLLANTNDAKGINDTTTYTVANAPTGWKSEQCPLTNFAIKNSTGSALTLTTDYVPTLSTGKFKLVNTVAVNTSSGMNTSLKAYVNYNYCPDGYITESCGRTVLDLVPGFFAIALMAIGVGLFYGVMKNEGLLGL